VALKEARQVREGGRWLLRAARRIRELSPSYDSEEEEEHGGFGFAGLLGRRWVGDLANPHESIPAGYEPDDCGEEADTWTRVLKKTKGRLAVWAGDRDVATHTALIQRAQAADDRAAAAASRRLTNGARKTGRRRASPVPATPVDGGSARNPTQTGKDLNDEITQDLLAERSDEDMDDDDSVDVDVDGDGDVEVEESDMDMD